MDPNNEEIVDGENAQAVRENRDESELVQQQEIPLVDESEPVASCETVVDSPLISVENAQTDETGNKAVMKMLQTSSREVQEGLEQDDECNSTGSRSTRSTDDMYEFDDRSKKSPIVPVPAPVPKTIGPPVQISAPPPPYSAFVSHETKNIMPIEKEDRTEESSNISVLTSESYNAEEEESRGDIVPPTTVKDESAESQEGNAFAKDAQPDLFQSADAVDLFTSKEAGFCEVESEKESLVEEERNELPSAQEEHLSEAELSPSSKSRSAKEPDTVTQCVPEPDGTTEFEFDEDLLNALDEEDVDDSKEEHQDDGTEELKLRFAGLGRKVLDESDESDEFYSNEEDPSDSEQSKAYNKAQMEKEEFGDEENIIVKEPVNNDTEDGEADIELLIPAAPTNIVARNAKNEAGLPDLRSVHTFNQHQESQSDMSNVENSIFDDSESLENSDVEEGTQPKLDVSPPPLPPRTNDTETKRDSGNGGGSPTDPLKEFASWLELIRERYHGPHSVSKEAVIEASLRVAKTPLKTSLTLQAKLPELQQVITPSVDKSASTEGRLQQMRKKAEDLAVATEHRKNLILQSHQTGSFATMTGEYIIALRSLIAPPLQDGEESEAALHLAHAIFESGVWDALFALYAIDSDLSLNGKRDPAAFADDNFSAVVSKQIKAGGSLNGELLRQYLNVVLRGLPSSPSLGNIVKKIPSQDAALSFTGNPDCAFALGKICSNFRRIILKIFESSLLSTSGSDEANNTLKVKALKQSVGDVCSFMSTLVRTIMWKYPFLIGSEVRDVAGDIGHGRIQDSRRGGDIPTLTRDVLLVVRTCVEDSIVDPLMDNLYLGYSLVYGKLDSEIFSKCSSLNQLPFEELMTKCGIPAFFQLEVANPSARNNRSKDSSIESPFVKAIETLVSVWVSARTPSSKICLLARAHQQCVDAVIRHYSRPTYEKNRAGQLVIRPTILDKSTLIPRKREMISIFTYIVIKSLPPNLETQSRMIFDMGSRHSVASSEVALHAVAHVFMSGKRILSI